MGANRLETAEGKYMNTLIIYGSQYGTARRYAEKFAEMTHFPVVSYEDIKTLTGYERIIYFGALYAGGVKGLKNTVKKLSPDTKLIIVTVGLADVCDQENISNIRNSLRKQVPEPLLKAASVFHLRGGIDYSKLNFKHRTMMKMLYHSLKSKPAESLTQEDKTFIETYNKKVDFVDYDSLKQIADATQ